MYVEVWSAIAAAAVPVLHALLRQPQPASLPSRKGPLDRFRVAGAYGLALAAAAFGYAFGDDPAGALPGLHRPESLWIWVGSTVVGLVAFALLCQQEARGGRPEAGALRLFWALELTAVGTIAVVRADPFASHGLASASTSSASVCFYVYSGCVAAVGAAYALFNAQVVTACC